MVHWPVDPVINSREKLVRTYIATPAGLFLAMAVPLHTQQLDELPRTRTSSASAWTINSSADNCCPSAAPSPPRMRR